jgi:hypothetical protein
VTVPVDVERAAEIIPMLFRMAWFACRYESTALERYKWEDTGMVRAGRTRPLRKDPDSRHHRSPPRMGRCWPCRRESLLSHR